MAEPESSAPDNLLSQAVVTYIWPGTTNYPTESEEAVLAGFGREAAPDLIASIHALLQRVWESEWPDGESVTDAAARIRGGMHEARPELSDEALNALVNSWAFNSR